MDMLEKEVRKRIARGVKLLDSVTPKWWDPINVDTLKISDRSMCVFAQASHSFTQGIVQVARSAIKQHIPVRLLKESRAWDVSYGEGFNGANWIKDKEAIDVFYYGFDVDESLKAKEPRYSRKASWDMLTKVWTQAVKAKKAGKAWKP